MEESNDTADPNFFVRHVVNPHVNKTNRRPRFRRIACREMLVGLSLRQGGGGFGLGGTVGRLRRVHWRRVGGP